ncbi:Uncharacterised protein [Escherichia coli]|uniref:Uncharacterized protein n=2 Tax=Enterobacteriaceae TaxID=543 RepID=A0A2X7F2U9_ECOLX|nr:hypothetical protein BvCms12BK_03150 [Escherichia coli]CAH6660860.1 hypothetical protein FBBNIHIM_17255 [Pseudocitrobacter vendiensis]SQP84378.1 Uncharacterised protein [Escherichia coli]SRY43484.1 Uncharacterised protein [Escherichia coli]
MLTLIDQVSLMIHSEQTCSWNTSLRGLWSFSHTIEAANSGLVLRCNRSVRNQHKQSFTYFLQGSPLHEFFHSYN